MVMVMDRVSETVALTTRPSYHQTSVYSQFEVCGHKRHKQEVTLRPVLSPVKYADTAFLFVNNTRKRFLSRTYYEPRIKPRSYADTTYANPTTTQERFVSFLDSHPDQLKSWFKTSVEIKPKNFKSSLSYPNVASSGCSSKTDSSRLTNGISRSRSTSPSSGFGDMEEVDENMNRRIPVFKEKYDPGASQVFIPKQKERSENDIILDKISDQILINSEAYNDFSHLNGHTQGLSDV